ncbi:Tas retrotransposon peptidase A16, partial [Oesophagostomum dentatum]
MSRLIIFTCKGAHHTSCCFNAKQNPKLGVNKFRSEGKGKETQSTKKTETSTHKPSKAVVSTISSDISTPAEILNNSENKRREHQAVLTTQNIHRSHLPTGEITVMDSNTKAFIKVDVLIDTGAEISFIGSALVQTLSMPVLGKKLVKLHTFGSNEIKERECELVKVQVRDIDGQQHILKLLTNDVLTQSFSPWEISAEDKAFLSSINISPPITKQKVVKPLILLGCDQLWSFINCNKPAIPLPSGLYLLSTRLGNLISGQESHNSTQVDVVSQEKDELKYWDEQWSMDVVQVCTISSESRITQEEKDRWDNDWAIDAAGTEEFNITEKEARDKLDKQVWQRFNETIQKRIDGYYVRLPWKDQYPHLPDNKALALKRLVNVWTSLKKNESILDQYYSVFQEQLRKDIIEEVDEK